MARIAGRRGEVLPTSGAMRERNHRVPQQKRITDDRGEEKLCFFGIVADAIVLSFAIIAGTQYVQRTGSDGASGLWWGYSQ